MPIYTVKAHNQIINCIDGVGGLGIGEGAPEILTASRDGEWNVFLCFNPYFVFFFLIFSLGSVKVWDPRQKDTPVAVIEPAENEAARDAWTACFG